MSISIIANELAELYSGQIDLENKEQTNLQLEKLIDDYKGLIGLVESDPNIIQRLGTVSLGAEPNRLDVAYPKVSPQELKAAQQAILKKMSSRNDVSRVPELISRFTRPLTRWCMFFAGAGLIIVAFTCFSRTKK